MVINNKLKSLTLLFLLITGLIFSQGDKKTKYVKPSFWNNVRFGGRFGLNFGNSFFSSTVAPSAIYDFNDSFALGLGLNATFINEKSVSKSTILGGSLISLINITPAFQTSTEFEYLNINREYHATLNLKNEKYWVPVLFIGIGYRNNNTTIGIRYDLLYNRNRSLYLTPWMPFFRIYF